MPSTTFYITVTQPRLGPTGWSESFKERWIETHRSPEDLMLYVLGRLDPFQK